jgi:hypothetical protein
MLTADAGFYKGSEKGLLTARNAPRSDRTVNFSHSGGRAHSSPAWTPRGENGSAAVIGIGWNDLDIRHQRASNLGRFDPVTADAWTRHQSRIGSGKHKSEIRRATVPRHSPR